MMIYARELDNRNIGQVVSLNNGNTIGQLSAIQRDTPSPGMVELTVGGSIVFELSDSARVEIYRDPILSHLVRREWDEEESDSTLLDGDLEAITEAVSAALTEQGILPVTHNTINVIEKENAA